MTKRDEMCERTYDRIWVSGKWGAALAWAESGATNPLSSFESDYFTFVNAPTFFFVTT